ncbi:MAG: histidinol-phosphate transaminase [Nitrospinae bacterium]|nr:histidinol-phosphate transaminase [Nitrospinota bacterium]
MGKQTAINAESLIRQRVRELSAYHVEPYPCEVALDANEFPYTPTEPLAGRIKSAIEGVKLNRYPDPSAARLKKAIAAKEGCSEANIILGNGSDEIIQALIAAICDPGDKVLVPSPTFSMYRIIAHYLNVDAVEVALNDDWTMAAEAMAQAIGREEPKIVFIASPNNPTGALYPVETVMAVIEAARGLVVIDEAYIDFAKAPYGPLFKEYPNVAILRTLSKAGFAALRLGYMMMDEKLCAQVEKVRLPYNINSVTQASAQAAVEEWGALGPLFRQVVAERERVFKELSSIKGASPFPSEANFILTRIEKDVEEVFARLLKQGVRVRWFKDDRRLGDCLRVTIGSAPENNRFIEAIKAAV